MTTITTEDIKMKDYTVTGTFTKAEMFGRLPTPKKGGAMKAKKGRGSYNRRAKHKESY